MKIKSRFLTLEEINVKLVNPTFTNVLLGTKILSNSFPVNKKTIGVVLLLDEITRENNKFNIEIFNRSGKSIGKLDNYKSNAISLETKEGFLCFNLKGLNFEDKDDFYKVEVHSSGKIFDTFKIETAASVFDVFENYFSHGFMPMKK